MTRQQIVNEVHANIVFFRKQWKSFCEWVEDYAEQLNEYQRRETGALKEVTRQRHDANQKWRCARAKDDRDERRKWAAICREVNRKHRVEMRRWERLRGRLESRGWAKWYHDMPTLHPHGALLTSELMVDGYWDFYAPPMIVNPVLWAYGRSNPREPDPDYQKESLLVDCALLVAAHDATESVKRIHVPRVHKGYFDCDAFCDELKGQLDQMDRNGRLERAWNDVRRYALCGEQNGEEPARGTGQAGEIETPSVSNRRFAVALSFPGERRDFVEGVASHLAGQVGRERVLYDKYHEAEFARINLDTHLQRLYHDESELIVVFLCSDYDKKEWCGLEWRAIRDLLKGPRKADVMLLRFDDATIPGLYSIDGYIPIGDRPSAEISNLILQRLGSSPTGSLDSRDV